QKYRICTADQQTFAFAGIFTVRFDPNTGDESLTYSILTTAANEFMAEIHNSKKRMPIILPNDLEGEWLANKLEAEQIPKVELVADKW
ncbi:MAG: SOS response-associated peptidase, partial [Cryomorphaceae bacterium]|nr:SOS response-associated peptidase [Cryomorphaceae bacterium]